MKRVKAFNRVLLVVLCLSFVATFINMNISPLSANPSETLIESYSEGNHSFSLQVKDYFSGNKSGLFNAVGQTFQTPSDCYNITSAKFYLNKSGNPTGYAHVALYMSDSQSPYGEPTGDPLAISEGFNVSTLTTEAQLITFTFNSSQRYLMSSSTYYGIVYQNPTSGLINSTNHVQIAADNTAPSHSGMLIQLADNLTEQPDAWEIIDYEDTVFYVYGELYVKSLSISSSPSSVSFTLNGTSKTTPYSDNIANGTYQINFTSSFDGNGGTWTFKWWADNHDTNPDRTINLQSNSSYSVVYTWSYISPQIVTLKCDGHGEEFSDWSSVGERTDALKELNDGNYVYDNVNGHMEGNFTFEDTSATGPINSVVLKLYAKSYYSATHKVYVYNGSWFEKTVYVSGWSWVSIDLSDTLTTWTKINNAKICLEVVGSFTWTVDAAKILVNPNVVHLHGLFDEDTGLMKALGERAVNVTVVLLGYVDETYVLNGSLDIAWATPILYIQFNTSVPRQYWFSTAETGTGDPVTIYVFDTSLTSYTISFLDLAGLLDDYPFITAKRYINGSLTIVEKRKVDAEDKVVMALKNGEKYSIVISDGVVGETYVFGDLTMTSVTILQLTLRGVDFPKATLLTYKYVRIYSHRAFATPCGNITVYYQDLLNMTNNVQIYIKYKNWTTVYYTIITANSSFIHVWASALNNTDYRVEVIIDHQKYGVYTVRQYFPMHLSKNPWGLAWFGNLPFDTALIIPFFIILFVGGCFSVINAEVGAVAMVITAMIVVYMWSIPIAPATLFIAFAFAILMAIVYAKRKVQT